MKPSLSSSSGSTLTEDNLVRTGILYKKGSKTGFFGRRNWKPRYFTLTYDKLAYYMYEGGEMKGQVDLRQCTDIQVMPSDCKKTGHSASSIWRIAINTPARRLVIAAASEFEMNEWLDDLREVVSRNDNNATKATERTSNLRPSLIDFVHVLERSNPRNAALVPAKTYLRRKVHGHHTNDSAILAA